MWQASVVAAVVVGVIAVFAKVAVVVALEVVPLVATNISSDYLKAETISKRLSMRH